MGETSRSDKFIAVFTDAARHFKVSHSERAAAAAALNELFERYEQSAFFSAANIPYFASHGTDHGVRLAEIATMVLKGVPRNGSKLTRNIGNAEALVLLFAALLLHDVGMSIGDDGLAVSTEHERRRIARQDHDERSLQFIERVLLASNAQMTQWDAFWKSRAGWVSPKGKQAFLLLARICKSHGDPYDLWLVDNSLDSYQSRVESKLHDFAADYASDWPAVRDRALAVATLLSLCDLCDIRPDRFPHLPLGQNAWLPDDVNELRQSFYHWAGHQVTSVDVSHDGIR